MARLSGSQALQADGFNNTSDIIASIAVLIGLKISRKPRDSDHPYGHWKAENISSLVASFIMMVIGLQVLYSAVGSIFHPESRPPDLVAAWTGLLAAGVMFAVYRYNKRLAIKTNSQALKAASKDNLSDAWVSIGAVVGIVGAQFHLSWLDPVAAFVVGLFICKTAWDIFAETSHTLTDGFDDTKLQQYEQTIEETEGVRRVIDLKGRFQGNKIILDAIIEVDPQMDVRKSHHITDIIEQKMKTQYGAEIHIHVEPDSDQ